MQLRRTFVYRQFIHIYIYLYEIYIYIYRMALWPPTPTIQAHTRTNTARSGHSGTVGQINSVTDDAREIFARHAAPMTASQKLNSCIFNSTANARKFSTKQKENRER